MSRRWQWWLLFSCIVYVLLALVVHYLGWPPSAQTASKIGPFVGLRNPIYDALKFGQANPYWYFKLNPAHFRIDPDPAGTSDGIWSVVFPQGAPGDPVARFTTLYVSRTSATQLTINPDCTATAPCTIRVGPDVFGYTTSATAVLTGSGTGTVRIYAGGNGTIYAGHNLNSGNVTCTGCVTVPGVADFPGNMIPAYSWPVTAGSFSPEQGLFDKRAFLTVKTITAGPGIIIGGDNIGINPAVVCTFSSGTGNPPAGCSLGQKYINTAIHAVWECTLPGTWTKTTL